MLRRGLGVVKTCIILTTIGRAESADNIALSLIDSNLAKCVQIDNVTSFYKWDNKLLRDNEFRLIIKACSSSYRLIEQMILDLHDYESPQIIKIDITDGLNSYLKWLTDK